MQNKFNSLQALRGITAVFIFFFHTINIVNKPLYTTIFGGAGLGVGIFFIISGFIISHSTIVKNKSKDKITTFLIKRIIRVIPLYFTLSFLWIILNKEFQLFHSNYTDLLKTIFFIPLSNTEGGPAYGMPPLFVGWTLNYEMFFYVLFSICLIKPSKTILILILVLFSTVFVLPYCYVGYITLDTKVNYNFYYNYLNLISNPIILNFLLGVVFSVIVFKIKVTTHFARISFLISVIAFMLFYLKVFDLKFGIIEELIFCGFLVLTFLVADNTNSAIKTPKALIYLGDISYSIYLSHPIIIAIFYGIFKKLHLDEYTSSYFFIILLFLMVILFSSITYELIEVRMSRYLKRKLLG